MRLALATAALAAAVGSVALSACERTFVGPPPCSARSPCGGDDRCVQGRCRPKGTEPIAADADRLTFEPVDAVWLEAAEEDGRAYLGARDGAATALLRFALRLPAEGRVQRALLVVEPARGCELRPGEVVISLASIRAPWRPTEISAAQLPPLGGFGRVATVPVTPPIPLRLDVTELVAEWRAHPARYHGLALRGRGTSPTGLCLATGAGADRGPRIDVYLGSPEDGEGGSGGEGGGGGSGGAGGAGGDG